MKIQKILVFSLLVFLSTNIFAAPKEITATTVTVFSPAKFVWHTKTGECFAKSIAVMREDAWRCGVGNEIYDPCFTMNNSKKLVCAADPSKNKKGFALKLAKPLPALMNYQAEKPKVNVWMVQLEDGKICTPYTGTMPVVLDENGAKGIKYGCTGTTKTEAFGLLDDSVKDDQIWTADMVVYAAEPTSNKIIKIQNVKIRKVWN